MKKCKNCGEHKEPQEMWSAGSLTCKDCRYISEVQRKFGLSREEYLLMIEVTGNRCEVCGVHADDLTGRYTRLAVDHCHRTGRVRGLLCSSCNRGLGMIGDSLERAESLARYLKQHPA